MWLVRDIVRLVRLVRDTVRLVRTANHWLSATVRERIPVGFLRTPDAHAESSRQPACNALAPISAGRSREGGGEIPAFPFQKP